MSESMYSSSTHQGRVQNHAQDLTPYSAVSSFNLPAQYDSSLITPVSLTSSPAMPTKPAPVLKKEPGIQQSPTTISPDSYHLFCADDEFITPPYNPPMKLKDPSGVLHFSTADNAFPTSPCVCTSPYYGPFGVSAPHSARTSNPSPTTNPSPHLHSAGGMSNSDSSQSRGQTPAQPMSASSYRSACQAPILIAPNPKSLKPATNNDRGPHRQDSLNSNVSNSSRGSAQGVFAQTLSPVPLRGKKRKNPPTDYETLVRNASLTPEEDLLLQLSERDGLPWKQIYVKFNAAMPQEKKVQVAALQMRKKRLLERLRVWTDVEEKALNAAHEEREKSKWTTVSNGMLNHGSKVKWSNEAVQKKWEEMHPEDTFSPEYEMMPSSRHRVSSDFSVQSSWSDEAESVTQSLRDSDSISVNLMSALSNSSMDEVRNRSLSNVNAQIHFQQQQQQMMFEQQRQQRQQQQHQQQHNQNTWNSRT